METHYLFRVLCFDYRIVDVRYFLDEMEKWEVIDIVNNIKYLDKNDRELGRYKIYATMLAGTGSKKLKMEDIMKLPWDDEFKNTGTPIDEEEAARIRERASLLAHAIENMKFSDIDNTSLLKNTTN